MLSSSHQGTGRLSCRDQTSMRARYPESADEKAARLSGAIRKMRLDAGIEEALKPILPSQIVIEHRIAARLKQVAGSDGRLADAVASNVAREGFNVARSLIAGD